MASAYLCWRDSSYQSNRTSCASTAEAFRPGSKCGLSATALGVANLPELAGHKVERGVVDGEAMLRSQATEELARGRIQGRLAYDNEAGGRPGRWPEGVLQELGQSSSNA